MAIGKNKTQILLSLDKEDKTRLEQIAKAGNLTLTKQINNIIKKFLNDYFKE